MNPFLKYWYTIFNGLGQKIVILTYISNLNINELKKNKEFL